MPRGPRLITPGVVYHLISRFVDRDWFIKAQVERRTYLRLLGRSLGESDWRCLAYAIMSSHIHLAMVAGAEQLAELIRRVHAPFAGWMNKRYDRIGTIFVRGPKDREVRPHVEPKVIAYIHNNPVEAGVVKFARRSGWTSHRAYVGLTPAPDWLHVAEGLARAGFESPREFDRWVDRTPGDPTIPELGMMRRAAHRRGALELATPTTSPLAVPLVARPWGHVRANPRVIVALVAAATKLDVMELASRRKYPLLVRARRIAAVVAAGLGLSGSDIAAALGLTQQAVSKLRRGALADDDRRLVAAITEQVKHKVVEVVSDPFST